MTENHNDRNKAAAPHPKNENAGQALEFMMYILIIHDGFQSKRVSECWWNILFKSYIIS